MVSAERARAAAIRRAILQCLQPSEFRPPQHGARRRPGKTFDANWLRCIDLQHIAPNRAARGRTRRRQQSTDDRLSGKAGILRLWHPQFGVEAPTWEPAPLSGSGMWRRVPHPWPLPLRTGWGDCRTRCDRPPSQRTNVAGAPSLSVILSGVRPVAVAIRPNAVEGPLDPKGFATSVAEQRHRILANIGVLRLLGRPAARNDLVA